MAAKKKIVWKDSHDGNAMTMHGLPKEHHVMVYKAMRGWMANVSFRHGRGGGRFLSNLGLYRPARTAEGAKEIAERLYKKTIRTFERLTSAG